MAGGRGTLRSAPHRVCFAAAALVWSVAALAWALQLGGAMTAPIGMQRWPSALHALVFSLGAMPLFIAGFLLTAGPKWLRVRAPESQPIGGAVALVVVGWALVIGAATVSVAGIGVGLFCGWCGARIGRAMAGVRRLPPAAEATQMRLAALGASAYIVLLVAAFLFMKSTPLPP